MKWIARWPGKILKPHDEQELLSLVGSGVLNVYDHVYDAQTKSWIRLVSLPQLQGQFSSVLGFEPPLEAPETQAFPCPDFHPPTLLIQHAMSPERSFAEMTVDYAESAPVQNHDDQFLQQMIEQLQEQNNELRQQVTNNPASAVREELEYEFKMQLDVLKESAAEEVQHLQNELEFLKTEAMSREDEVQGLRRELEEYKGRANEYESANSQLNIQLSQKEEKLEEYLKENEKIVSEFKKLAQNNQAMKDRLNEVANKVEKERRTSATLKQNVLKLNEGLVLLKRKNERDRTVIQDLERYKKIHDAKEEQELNRLIGDSFEVDNSAIWMIRIDEEEKGPYTYGDMRSFLKYNKISMDTSAKKTGGKWLPLNGHFEFKNDVLRKEEVRDGKKVERFFIKRGDFRAPFYDLAQIDIGAQTFKGYCTSISVGGCFIELSKIDKMRMQRDSKITVKIKAGTLSEEITVQATIRNISDKRPRGLGIEFEELAPGQRDVIIEFVQQYVSSSVKKAA